LSSGGVIPHGGLPRQDIIENDVGLLGDILLQEDMMVIIITGEDTIRVLLGDGRLEKVVSVFFSTSF
jgi:hypothetical protein